MERIETPEELATWITTGNKTMEYVRGLITARDEAIRAEAAEDAIVWFEARRKERHERGNEHAIHASIRAAICRKEMEP